MIQTAQSLEVTAILRMKKGNMKYRVSGPNGKIELLDAKALYRRAVKGAWKKVRGMPYRAVSLDIELDLTEEEDKESKCIDTKLLFARGVSADEKASAGKKDRALFLTTAPSMSLSKVLEVYALHRGIETFTSRRQNSTWDFSGADLDICLSRGVYSSDGDTLFDVAVCQT